MSHEVVSMSWYLKFRPSAGVEIFDPPAQPCDVALLSYYLIELLSDVLCFAFVGRVRTLEVSLLALSFASFGCYLLLAFPAKSKGLLAALLCS